MRPGAPKRTRVRELKPAGGPAVPPGMTPAMYEFCLRYLANGFNAASAYRASHPGVSSSTARTEGWRLLTNPDIRVFLDERMAAHWQALQMAGDEALGRVALAARSDPRDLFDGEGKMLPPQHWPAEIALVVKSYKMGPNGPEIRLDDRLAALRIILEQTGRLRSGRDDVDALAQAIRADIARSNAP